MNKEDIAIQIARKFLTLNQKYHFDFKIILILKLFLPYRI